MRVTELGIWILVKRLQSLKAPPPILVTELGILMRVKLLQSLKASYLMLVILRRRESRFISRFCVLLFFHLIRVSALSS